MKNHLVSFILSLTVLLTFLLSCSDKQSSFEKADITPSGNSLDTDTEVDITNLTAELPQADYNNENFTILLAGNWDFDDFTAEEEIGEPINDAIYKKNQSVMEKYNVNITTQKYQLKAMESLEFFRKSVNAGDDAFDAAMMGSYQVTILTTEGCLTDLNEVPYLDLNKPWWEQKANEELSIKDKIFFATGAITTLLNDCTYCVLFNKKLIKDYNLQNPYEMVKNSTWTIDNWIAMIKQVSGDIDGNGIYDEKDMYGNIVWDDSILGIITGIGEKFATLNANGNLDLTLNTPRVLSVFDKYLNTVKDKTIAYHIDPSNEYAQDIFANNRGLFYTRYLRAVSWFRNMETDFGILPYPKLEETQDRYYSNVHAYGSSFVCIPTSCPNLERTGIILEALASESYYTLKPAYYETTLVGKFIRDNESGEMLDIILSNRVYDLGLYYQVGTYNEQMMDIYRKNKGDFTSTYEKYETKALKDIDKINTAFEQYSNK